MKLFITRLIKIQAFALFGFFILFPLPSYSGEFLVVDREISWGTGADTSFNWFLPATGVPSNWLSPDYYNGAWYIRYEVLSVKTNTAFGMQFGIIQHDTGKLYE